MSSSAVMVSAPTSAPASLHNYLLLAGGYFSLAFAAFQVSAIWWSPSAVRYFGGPAELSMERPILYAVLCLAVSEIVAVFGVYALSGAGKIRRLPLLRTVLIAVTGIYLLRGLLIIPQAPVVLKHPGLVRFLVFSTISLCLGMVHLAGVVQIYRHGRPGDAPSSRIRWFNRRRASSWTSATRLGRFSHVTCALMLGSPDRDCDVQSEPGYKCQYTPGIRRAVVRLYSAYSSPNASLKASSST